MERVFCELATLAFALSGAGRSLREHCDDNPGAPLPGAVGLEGTADRGGQLPLGGLVAGLQFGAEQGVNVAGRRNIALGEVGHRDQGAGEGMSGHAEFRPWDSPGRGCRSPIGDPARIVREY